MTEIDKIRNTLIKLIKENNFVNFIKYVKEYTVKLNELNKNDFDLLLYALDNNVSTEWIKFIIIHGHYKTLNYVLEKPNMNYRSKIPLEAALYNTNFKVANLLIHYGAEINYIPPGLLASILNTKNYRYLLTKDIPISLSLLSNLIKLRKNHLLNSLFTYYLLDNSFILDLLSYYKNKKCLRQTQLLDLMNKEKSKINDKDDKGNTILTYAIIYENESFAKYLINEGADTNLINGNGKTPLTIAIENYNRDMARYLIDHGADISMENGNGYTPLTMATENFYIEMIGYLIDHGADIDGIDGNNNTPLTAAIKNDDDDIVEYLINRGADINKIDGHGNTPLTTAIKDYLYFGTIKYLIDKGADITIKDGQGNTPLEIAVKTSSLFTVEYLLTNCKAGEQLKQEDYYQFYSTAIKNVDNRMVEILNKYGTSVSTIDSYTTHKSKESLLTTAIHQSNLSMIQCLIDCGVKIIINDLNMESHLVLAIIKGDDSMVECLLNNCTDIIHLSENAFEINKQYNIHESSFSKINHILNQYCKIPQPISCI